MNFRHRFYLPISAILSTDFLAFSIVSLSIINSLVIESITDFYDLDKLDDEYLLAITKINIFDILEAYLNSLEKENISLVSSKILSEIIFEQTKKIPFNDQKIKLSFECFKYENIDECGSIRPKFAFEA